MILAFPPGIASTKADETRQQWDHCLSTLMIRSALGASFGIIFSVLLFKRRAWPVWTGLGFGAGEGMGGVR